MSFKCKYCGKKVASSRGLRQHILSKKSCNDAWEADIGVENATKPSALQDGFLKCVALSLQQKEANIGHRSNVSGAKRNYSACESNEDQLFLRRNNNHGSQEYEDDDMPMGYAEPGDEGNEAPETDPKNPQIDESMRADFKNYCKEAANH
jgi:hypothetical protein